MNLSSLNNTEFKPFKHSYTVYTVANPKAIYIESNIHGDEKAVTYYFNDAFEIEDEEGSFSPSDAFEAAVIALVKSTVK